MSNILKKLGDNWHVEHAYQPLIDKIVPNSLHKHAIERVLLEIYVSEHNEFKQFQMNNNNTLYDYDIEMSKQRKKETQEELEKEEKNFQKLMEKFQQMEAPESSTEEEVENEEEEEEIEVNRKGKGQKACKRTLKAEEQHKRSLVKGIKASLASSQQKLMDLNEYIQQLDTKIDSFIHYQKASRYYQQTLETVVKSYVKNKDIEKLVKDLDSTIDYYEMMMRRYVSKDPCEGSYPGPCKTHFLPLQAVKYTVKGEIDDVKCAATS